MKVKAIEAYSNGMIPGAADWPAGEVRDLPASSYEQLMRDLPNNFSLLPPDPEEEPVPAKKASKK